MPQGWPGANYTSGNALHDQCPHTCSSPPISLGTHAHGIFQPPSWHLSGNNFSRSPFSQHPYQMESLLNRQGALYSLSHIQESICHLLPDGFLEEEKIIGLQDGKLWILSSSLHLNEDGLKISKEESSYVWLPHLEDSWNKRPWDKWLIEDTILGHCREGIHPQTVAAVWQALALIASSNRVLCESPEEAAIACPNVGRDTIATALMCETIFALLPFMSILNVPYHLLKDYCIAPLEWALHMSIFLFMALVK